MNDRRYRVLVVDDEPLILDGMIKTYDFQKHGFEVCGAATGGEEALKMAHDLMPNVLMTDIRMKKMDGLELIRHFTEINEDAECVVFSAYDDFHWAQQAMELGAFSYLLKPFSDDEFARVMGSLYERLCEKEKQRCALKFYTRFIRRADEDIGAANEGVYVLKAQEYVTDHISDPELSVVKVAQALFLNPLYFGRMFKAETGCAFREYLNVRRMEMAKELISSTDMSVTEVALAIGMENLSYFSCRFKQYAGLSPSEYKAEAE